MTPRTILNSPISRLPTLTTVLRRGVYVIAMLLCLGQLQRVPLSPTLAVYGHDLAILSWLSLAWITQPFHLFLYFKKTLLALPPLMVLILALLCLGWLRTVLAGTPILIPLLYTLRLTAYLLFCGTVFHLKLFTSSQLKHLLGYMGVLWAFWGWLQYLLLPDTRFLRIMGWDDHYYRLMGTSFDPNFTGILLVIALAYWESIYASWPNFPKWGIRVFFILSILFTYSRASYLALAVFLMGMGCYHFWLQARATALTYIAMLIMVLSGIFFLPQPGGEGVNLARTSSIVARTSTAQRTLHTFQTTDIFVGRGLFVPATNPFIEQLSSQTTPFHAQMTDNIILLIFSAVGLLGILLTAIAVSRGWLHLFTHDHSLAIVLVSVFCHAQFNNSFFEPFIFLYLGLGMISAFKS